MDGWMHALCYALITKYIKTSGHKNEDMGRKRKADTERKRYTGGETDKRTTITSA